MKKLLFFVLFIGFIWGCQDNENGSFSTQHSIVNNYELDRIFINPNTDKCVRVFYPENNTLKYKIRMAGEYHNDILFKLSRKVDISNSCDINQLIATERLIDNYIKETPPYDNFFQETNLNTGLVKFYSEYANICDETFTPQELLSKSIDRITSLSKPHFNDFEYNILLQLSDDISKMHSIDVIKYMKLINKNRDKVTKNIEGILVVLAIYENSACFWENYYSSNELVESRLCWVCPALWDAAGAYLEFLISGVDGYISEGELKNVARAGIEASLPLGGGHLADALGL